MYESDIIRHLNYIRKELFPRRRLRMIFANIFAIYIYLSLLTTTSLIVILVIFGGEVDIITIPYDHLDSLINQFTR